MSCEGVTVRPQEVQTSEICLRRRRARAALVLRSLHEDPEFILWFHCAEVMQGQAICTQKGQPYDDGMDFSHPREEVRHSSRTPDTHETIVARTPVSRRLGPAHSRSKAMILVGIMWWNGVISVLSQRSWCGLAGKNSCLTPQGPGMSQQKSHIGSSHPGL